MNFLSVCKTVGGFCKKNAPVILTVAAVGGAVSTTVLAVNATYKAGPMVAEMKAQHAPGKEIIKKAAPFYIPTGIALLSTVACICGAHASSAKQLATMASLYSSGQIAAGEVWKQIEEKYGEKAKQEIEHSINQKRIEDHPPVQAEVISTGQGDVLCYDKFSGRYFTASKIFLERVEVAIGRRIQNEMWVTWNDIYSELYMPEIKGGNDRYFNSDHPLKWKVEYGTVDNERPCLILDTWEDALVKPY